MMLRFASVRRHDDVDVSPLLPPEAIADARCQIADAAAFADVF